MNATLVFMKCSLSNFFQAGKTLQCRYLTPLAGGTVVSGSVVLGYLAGNGASTKWLLRWTLGYVLTLLLSSQCMFLDQNHKTVFAYLWKREELCAMSVILKNRDLYNISLLLCRNHYSLTKSSFFHQLQ